MIFGNDREQLRRQYRRAWRKHQAGEPLEPLERLIAGVVAMHPEYHRWIESESALVQNFDPTQGQTNPFLHMGMHIALAEQVGTDRPAGIHRIHQRLTQKYGSPHEAEHQMMECLGRVLWEAQRDNRPPDEKAYLECLKRLL